MFPRVISRIRDEEKGEALVEYGLIIAMIAILLIGILIAVNGGVNSIYGNITDSLKNSGNN